MEELAKGILLEERLAEGASIVRRLFESAMISIGLEELWPGSGEGGARSFWCVYTIADVKMAAYYFGPN